MSGEENFGLYGGEQLHKYINQFWTLSLLNVEVKMYVIVGEENFGEYGGNSYIMIHQNKRQEYKGSPDA